jgi:predicted RNA-binding protein
MCQISVVVENNGDQEAIMDNVTSLQVTDEGVVLTTFFEEPLSVPDVVVSRIDFLGGKVVLNREQKQY